MSKKQTQIKKVSFKSKIINSLSKTKIFFKYFFALVFIVVSLIFLYDLPFSQKVNTSNPIRIDKSFQEDHKKSEIPLHILIPSVKINLPIVEAPIVNGYWALSDASASHGEGSAGPGEKGNMVIFAHAREGLFYNLKDIKKNDKIYVLTKKTWREYKVNQIKTVYPNEVSVIRPTKNETITLFTCSGFYDEKRLIVQAIPTQI